MLALLQDQAFDRSGWLFEIKFDGYRAIADVSKTGVELYSRNHKTFNQRFGPICEQLRSLGHEAVLDGEVVALDSEGQSQFQLLQNYQKTGAGNLAYFAFDLLYLDGHDLRQLPLLTRKAILAQILPALPSVKCSEHVEERGLAFFQAVAKRGLEGMIAKRADSPYRDGQRGGDWIKIKTYRRQEAVIAGFTEPRGGRQHLGAFILGVYERDALVYIGHTGGRLDAKGLAAMRARLDPLVQSDCPFAREPKTNARVHWVRPTLVCEIRFQEWTQDGHMRQPIFLGLREDKDAADVRREEPPPVGQAKVPTIKRKR